MVREMSKDVRYRGPLGVPWHVELEADPHDEGPDPRLSCPVHEEDAHEDDGQGPEGRPLQQQRRSPTRSRQSATVVLLLLAQVAGDGRVVPLQLVQLLLHVVGRHPASQPPQGALRVRFPPPRKQPHRSLRDLQTAASETPVRRTR